MSPLGSRTARVSMTGPSSFVYGMELCNAYTELVDPRDSAR